MIRRDLTAENVARVARARYLAALADVKVEPVAERDSALLDAVEGNAVRIELQRARFVHALATWQHAEAAETRFAAEVELFDSIERYVVVVPPNPGHGGLGALLAGRIARASSEGRDGVNAHLFGLTLPPAWMVVANVPPRLVRLRPTPSIERRAV